MTAINENSPERGNNPEVFDPQVLVGYLLGQFDRAFMLDGYAMDNDSLDVNNGRFTHFMHPTIEKRPLLQNTWRINLWPPSGSHRRSNRAWVYLALDPSIDVMSGQDFEPAGKIYVEERIKSTWKPLVVVDAVGATPVEETSEINFESAEDLLKIFSTASREDPGRKRAMEIFGRLGRCNLVATVN